MELFTTIFAIIGPWVGFLIPFGLAYYVLRKVIAYGIDYYFERLTNYETVIKKMMKD